jgi:hypothetical protein
MYKEIAVLIFIASVTSFVLGDNEKYAVANQDTVAVFKNENHLAGETPLFTISRQDRPLIIAAGSKTYEIQKNNLVGWVEKELVAVSFGKTMVFDTANVMGYLDNPTAIYIIDANNPAAEPIKLERSFAIEIQENVDRETVERQVAK